MSVEVLNRNQRRSALWRLFFLGFFIVAITGSAIGAIYQAYANGNRGALDDCESRLLEQEQIWKGKHQDLVNKNRQLEKQLRALQSKENAPNAEVVSLQQQIKLKDERIKYLESDLTRCQNRLNTPVNN